MMRPMVWERNTRSAPATASASGAPRLMAPAPTASAMARSELTPVMEPPNPASRNASPKEAPIRPVPIMATLFMVLGGRHSWHRHARIRGKREEFYFTAEAPRRREEKRICAASAVSAPKPRFGTTHRFESYLWLDRRGGRGRREKQNAPFSAARRSEERRVGK